MVTTKKLLLKIRLHGVRPKLATTTRKLLKLRLHGVRPKLATKTRKLLKLSLQRVRPKLATTTKKLLKLSLLRVLTKWTTTPTSRTGGVGVLGALTTSTTTWPLPIHTRCKGRVTKSTTQACPQQATLTTIILPMIPTGSGAPVKIGGARPQGRMRSGNHLINEDTVAVNERRLYLLTPACAC